MTRGRSKAAWIGLRCIMPIYLGLNGTGIAKDIVVVTESDVRMYGDNPSLLLFPALREGREIYRARE